MGEVQTKYSRKGKVNEKISCTPINPKKYPSFFATFSEEEILAANKAVLLTSTRKRYSTNIEYVLLIRPMLSITEN